MLQHVLAPDVDDERDLRPDRRNVVEVLFGAHAEIDTAGPRRTLQRSHDLGVIGFVGKKILRLERTVIFRKGLH